MSAKPAPGSDAARLIGCKCPVIDNGHGRGSGRVDDNGKPAYWINAECPVHGEMWGAK